jgi:predicted nucleotide-binding protein (sugar kinase/HSP70/actin superfamily)
MKPLLCIFLVFFSYQSFASTEFHKTSNDWGYMVFTDDFDDSKSCAVMTIAKLDGKYPNITFWVNTDISKSMARVYGVGIKYRVDKKKPFLLGYESATQMLFNTLLIDDSEIVNNMITKFKKGNDLVYEIFSSKKFIHSGNYKISLKGFTAAYNKAVECN